MKENISVCMIVKNEEKNISECLSRLSPYPFELVVVDTGSTDQTVAIARSFTDHVYSFPWCDDFSAARNFSLKKASHDWVLVVDCDEYLEELYLEELLQLMKQYPAYVGQITRHSLCHNGDSDNLLTDYVERLFDRRLYHYEGIIHEQVVPIDAQTAAQNTLTAFQIPAVFYHVGYNGSQNDLEEKAQRNISLLLKELEKTPNDVYLYYQLGESYSLKGDYEQAFQYYDKGFYLDVDETLPYVKIMITSYGYSMMETGRLEQALGLEGVFETFKTYADFVCMMGCLYLRVQQNQKALELFSLALTLTDHSVEGSNSFIPLHNIGCIYEAYGYFKEALDAYQKAANYKYTPSIQRMKNLEERIHARK